MIREKCGFERLINFLTDKRKFHCVECGQNFRAPDRRGTPRGNPGDVYGVAHHAGR
jgi:hypothetical protein